MKLRNVLYGYHYENGRVSINDEELKIVKEIRATYLDGKSLRLIAEDLNERKIEYMPGVTGWNKARLMRMLDDKGYLGNEKYSSTLEQEEYDRIQILKQGKNVQKDLDRQADIFQIDVPVCCPNCGKEMKRKFDKRWSTQSRWCCKKVGCKTTIGKEDESLLTEITDLLNAVIDNPTMLEVPPIDDTGTGQMDHTIEKIVSNAKFDQETARKKLLEQVSREYEKLEDCPYKAQKLKDIFIGTSRRESFDSDLLIRTVDEIKLYMDGTIGLILENKQEVRNGGVYATREESCKDIRADNIHPTGYR